MPNKNAYRNSTFILYGASNKNAHRNSTFILYGMPNKNAHRNSTFILYGASNKNAQCNSTLFRAMHPIGILIEFPLFFDVQRKERNNAFGDNRILLPPTATKVQNMLNYTGRLIYNITFRKYLTSEMNKC